MNPFLPTAYSFAHTRLARFHQKTPPIVWPDACHQMATLQTIRRVNARSLQRPIAGRQKSEGEVMRRLIMRVVLMVGQGRRNLLRSLTRRGKHAIYSTIAILLLLVPEFALAQGVTVANAMLKIHPTDGPASSTTAEIHAARNEFEAFQLVVRGPATGVSVSAPVLVGPGGAAIPGTGVRLYREAYQNITTPSNTEGATGLWPDALIPDVDETANEKRNAFPFDVPAGENRVVWVEVHVPQ